MIEKQLRRYILPNVIALIGISCYILADTFFIAKAEGANGITALNLVLPLYGLIYAIGSMIGIGSATRYSLDKGQGTKDYNDYFSNSFIWTLFVSLIFVVAGFFMADDILRFMGADDTILEIGYSYTRIVLWFAPFFMLNFTFTSFVRNDGAPNTAMAATLLSGVFNIIFDYIFMFPMKMGMDGAALATGLSPIVSMLICMKHYLSKQNTIRFVKKLPSPRKFINSCKLGVFAFVGEISNGITTMAFNFVLLGIDGNVAVAAYGVVANIAIVGISLYNGVSQGLQPIASENHSRNDKDSERRIYRHSLKIGIIISILLVGSVLVFADKIVAIFNSDNSAQLAAYAETGIRLYFLGFLVASINIIKAGFYSAIDKAKESAFIAISRGVVSIVFFVFVLSKVFGITGVWLAFPASELFTLILTKIMDEIVRAKRLKRKYVN